MNCENSYDQTLEHTITKKQAYFSPVVYQFQFSPIRNQTISATRYQLIDKTTSAKKMQFGFSTRARSETYIKCLCVVQDQKPQMCFSDSVYD